MQATEILPKILVYETFDGQPIYRKGYKDFLLGIKKIAEITMGTSTLQWFITTIITKYLNRLLPDSYLAGAAELGIHVSHNTILAVDIAIFRSGVLNIGFQSVNYSEIPPNVVVEVDIKVDESEFFKSETEYFNRKTEKLLKFGVERVIWILPSSQRIMIASNLQRWEFISWDETFEIIDGLQINVWDLMLKNGFQEEIK